MHQFDTMSRQDKFRAPNSTTASKNIQSDSRIGQCEFGLPLAGMIYDNSWFILIVEQNLHF